MASRSTPEGDHRPVMLAETLHSLAPQPGDIAVDCTLGAAGHACELLQRVGPTGRLIALDLDEKNIDQASVRLSAIGHPFELHAANFAGLARWATEGANVVLADLGVSSMQIDDPHRGFSYRRAGPLDMRMDRRRGRTAAQLLTELSAADVAQALRQLGDFDEFGKSAAERLAEAIIAAKPDQTDQLTDVILKTIPAPVPPIGAKVKPWQLKYRPVACAFQALRILVNRELANLAELLRVLPAVLRPGGRAAIISFHSGEDRLVKQSFRQGLRAGDYSAIADDAIRATSSERYENPRSRSAKLRWAKRA